MFDITDNSPVRELQEYLLAVSYATHGLPHIAVDGIFGEETRQAVLVFQAQNALPVTGVADAATWAEIYRQYAEVQAEAEPHFLPLPPEALPLSLRDEGADVLLLEVLLSAVGEALLDTLGEIKLNGRYDLRLQEAVRAYQRFRRLPPSGSVDRTTWAALADDYYTLPRDMA